MSEVLARICVFCAPHPQPQGSARTVEATIQTVNRDDAFTFEIESDRFDLVTVTVRAKEPDAVFHGMPLLNALQRLGIVVFCPAATGKWQVHNL